MASRLINDIQGMQRVEVPRRATHYRVNAFGVLRFYAVCDCGCNNTQVYNAYYDKWVDITRPRWLSRVKFHFEEEEIS